MEREIERERGALACGRSAPPVRMHAPTHARKYVCIYTYTHTGMCLYVLNPIRFMCLRVCAPIHICTCMCIDMHAAHIHACMYVYRYTCPQMRRIHMDTYVRTFVYIHS
jgi:hypothetical protein